MSLASYMQEALSGFLHVYFYVFLDSLEGLPFALITLCSE